MPMVCTTEYRLKRGPGFKARVWLTPASDAFLGPFLVSRHPPLVAEFGGPLRPAEAELRFVDDAAWRGGARSVLVEIWTKHTDAEVHGAFLGMPVRLGAPGDGDGATTIASGITCDRFLGQDYAYPADILLRLDPDGRALPASPDRRLLTLRPEDISRDTLGYFDPAPSMRSPGRILVRQTSADGQDLPWRPHAWEQGLWACLTHWSSDLSFPRAGGLDGYQPGERVSVWDGDRHVATGQVQAVPHDVISPLLHPPIPRWLPLSAADLGRLAKHEAPARKPY